MVERLPKFLKMDSFESSRLQDIDDKFCQCSICLQQYREPKLLPCLHRYCSDCLKQLIERNQGVTVISCPECRDEVTIPAEGVDGFKTDFYMKNIIEYIQIEKSLVDERLRQCYNCSKNLKLTAYCFKCNGFLCKECHEIHVTGKSLKDHRRHALSLEDMKSKHMKLEKLSDLKEAPRCQSHLNELCLLCCRTCNELPICVACVHGRHKNHDINDVEKVAAEVREKLQNEMKNLEQYGERMLGMPQTIDGIKGYITSNCKENIETVTIRYDEHLQKFTEETEKIERDFQGRQTEIDNNTEMKLTKARRQMDEEIKQIKITYDNMFDEIEKKRRVQLESLRKEKEDKLEKRKETFVILEGEFKRFLDTFAKKQEEGLAEVEFILQQIVGTIGRYENLTATGNSVLETRNDWTAVQCIPDIFKAIEPLKEDIKREFPELDKLSRIGVTLEVKEDEESPVNIEGVKAVGWKILAITGVSDGSIVITGHTPENYQSHITVINKNGKVVRRKKLIGTYTCSFRYCAHLSELKIATIALRDEIGVFDIRDYSYIKKNISDVISSLPSDRWAWCVTTDPVNNHILVGWYECRDVYVFDDQMNYHHTLTLPEVIEYPRDMALNEGKLLVCDPVHKKVYAVTMEGQGGKVVNELAKPDYDRGSTASEVVLPCFDRDDWDPLSVCKDSNGLIYVLWKTYNTAAAKKSVVTQYTQDGLQLVTNIRIDGNDGACIGTVRAGMTEILLVATGESGKLHTYIIG